VSAPDVLRWGVAACALGAATALVVQAYGTRAFGLRPPQAAPSASAWRGIAYAFGAGMSPAAKESTRSHPFVYALGVSYHLGIFTALATLLWVVIAGPDRGQPVAAVRAAIVVLMAAGTVSGVALLVRRARMSLLRSISVPDDYVANALTTAFIALAALHLVVARLESAFLVVAMLLLAYAPLGKIRHCLFFFIARGHLGRHYGRRGTFPLRH
jgi:predicted small integral membrane protein